MSDNGTAAPDPNRTAQDYLAPLRTHRRVVVVVAAVTLLLGVVVAFAVPRTYTATTAILIYPVSSDPTEALGSIAESSDMGTETRIANSRAVAQATADGLAQVSVVVDSDTTASRIQAVNRPEGSRVIDVAYRAPDPAQARLGSDLAAAAYLEYRAELSARARDEAEVALATRMEALQDRLADVEQRLKGVIAGSSAEVLLEVERASIEGQIGAQQVALANLSTVTADTASVIDQARQPTSADGLGPAPVLFGALAGGLVLGLVAAFALAAAGVAGATPSPAEPTTGNGGGADDEGARKTGRSRRSRITKRGSAGADGTDSELDDVDGRDPLELLRALDALELSGTPGRPTPAVESDGADIEQATADGSGEHDTERSATDFFGEGATSWDDMSSFTDGVHDDDQAGSSDGPSSPDLGTDRPEEFSESDEIDEIDEIGDIDDADEIDADGIAGDPTLGGDALGALRELDSLGHPGAGAGSEPDRVVAAPSSEQPTLDESPWTETLEPAYATDQASDGQADRMAEQHDRAEGQNGTSEAAPTYQDGVDTADIAFPAHTTSWDEPPPVGDEHSPNTGDEHSPNTGDPGRLAPGPASWSDPFAGPTTWEQLAGDGTPDDTSAWPEPAIDRPDATVDPGPDPAVDPEPGDDSDPTVEEWTEIAAELPVVSDDRDALFARLGELGASGPVVLLSLGDDAAATGLTAGFELADELRSLGARVLLIDALLETPALDSLFADGGQHGLAQVLTGELVLARAARTLPDLDGLSILTVGSVDDGTADRLTDGSFERLLAEARLDHHSVIIIGGAPAATGTATPLNGDRARALAAGADGIIVGSPLAPGMPVRPELAEALAELPVPTLQVISVTDVANVADGANGADGADGADVADGASTNRANGSASESDPALTGAPSM